MNLALAILASAGFFSAAFCLAACRVAADADASIAHLQPQQGTPSSDSERDGGAQQHHGSNR